MNVPEMLKYKKEVAYAINAVCEILAKDRYYPPEKQYETAIAVVQEVSDALEGLYGR